MRGFEERAWPKRCPGMEGRGKALLGSDRQRERQRQGAGLSPVGRPGENIPGKSALISQNWAELRTVGRAGRGYG